MLTVLLQYFKEELHSCNDLSCFSFPVPPSLHILHMSRCVTGLWQVFRTCQQICAYAENSHTWAHTELGSGIWDLLNTSYVCVFVAIPSTCEDCAAGLGQGLETYSTSVHVQNLAISPSGNCCLLGSDVDIPGENGGLTTFSPRQESRKCCLQH